MVLGREGCLWGTWALLYILCVKFNGGVGGDVFMVLSSGIPYSTACCDHMLGVAATSCMVGVYMLLLVLYMPFGVS